jgi:hypothetical protein
MEVADVVGRVVVRRPSFTVHMASEKKRFSFIPYTMVTHEHRVEEVCSLGAQQGLRFKNVDSRNKALAERGNNTCEAF